MSIEHSTAAFYSRHFVILISPGKWCNEEGLILGSMAFSKHAIKTQIADVCRSQSGTREIQSVCMHVVLKVFSRQNIPNFFYSSPSPWMSKISKYTYRKPWGVRTLLKSVRSRWQNKLYSYSWKMKSQVSTLNTQQVLLPINSTFGNILNCPKISLKICNMLRESSFF